MKKYLLLLLLFFSSFDASSKTEVTLYTYHLKPPFVVELETETGLYYDLANYLTELSEDYQFTTVFLPRKRLNLLLKQGNLTGVVVGVSPIWFKDKKENKYLWLPNIYEDRDEFVSLKTAPFEFDGKASLTNKTLAGVAGYYYFGVNEAVKDNQLQRIDTIGEAQVLRLIAKQRADMGIVSRSVFKYLEKNQKVQDIFHFSNRPHDAFKRRAFIPHGDKNLQQQLSKIIDRMPFDPHWQTILNKYQ